jgi:hypothetical protein
MTEDCPSTYYPSARRPGALFPCGSRGCMALVPARQSGLQKALAQSMTKAVISEDYATLKRHVDAEADLELSEGSGWTPLILAAWYGQLDMLKLLLDAGASVAAADRNGWTAYHHACFGGHTECVELLVEKGADVAAVESDGKTGRDMAIQEKHEQLVEMLVEQGVPERDQPPDPPPQAQGDTGRAKKKRKKAEHDGPRGPKRALSAYMFFLAGRRPALLEEQPEIRCAPPFARSSRQPAAAAADQHISGARCFLIGRVHAAAL